MISYFKISDENIVCTWQNKYESKKVYDLNLFENQYNVTLLIFNSDVYFQIQNEKNNKYLFKY